MSATEADLELLKSDLKLFEADLGGRIKEVRVEMGNLGRDLSGDFARLRGGDGDWLPAAGSLLYVNLCLLL